MHNLKFCITLKLQHKKPIPSGQTRELLSILPRRGKKAYDSFLNALDASTNEEVADYLREKDGSKSSQNARKPDDESKNSKGDDDEVKKTSTHHSENPDKTNKPESSNSNQGHEGMRIRLNLFIIFRFELD